jgi:hypothetical protein
VGERGDSSTRGSSLFIRDGVTYEFHHIGIPTAEIRAGERYSARFGMYTSDSECQLARVQYHRFDVDSCLHPMLQSKPHPAFKVDNLGRAIENRILLLGPHEPIDGFLVAIILDGDMPIELIQTTLSDHDVWERASMGQNASIYDGRSAPSKVKGSGD